MATLIFPGNLMRSLAAAVLAIMLAITRPASGEPPFQLPPPSELNKIRSAVVETEKGEIYFEMYPEDAPWHVANFKHLADKGFYRGLPFHIVLPGYIVQGGAPRPDPASGPGYTLPAEFNDRRHRPGTLGMARLENALNPERRSNGSQFHILLARAPHMDGDYTVFGQLVKGWEILEQIEKGDRIRDVRVFVRKGG